MSVFVSHSRKDKEFRIFFDEIFAGTSTKAIRVEFEEYELPPWEAIKEWIERASTLFLLLSPELKDSPYTQNWVAFEVGLACGLNIYKPVWTFERIDKPVEFPVPYTNHYMIVDINDSDYTRYIKEIVKCYEPFSFLRALPRGVDIKCPYKNCGVIFQLHTRVEQFKCPSCRQAIKIP